MIVRRVRLLATLALVCFMTLACSKDDKANYPTLAESVDLERFMGKWYVHGYTPTFLDKEAYNPTETYEMGENGKILTTYNFRKGGFDGPVKTYRPVGKSVSESNAEWRMRFFSIISAPYLILYRDEKYEYTLIGHPNREMAWLMSRSPKISDDKYEELVEKLEGENYDLSKFVRAKHESPETS